MGVSDIAVLNGGFAPVDQEWTLDLTEVEGEIPRDLNGLHVRNGPNRRFEAPGCYRWFDGDGMLHAVRFEGGRCPVNMSGGLIGCGHPVGATGARMVWDAARQVTGQAGDSQIAAAQRVQTLNIGGSCATVVSFVVQRD